MSDEKLPSPPDAPVEEAPTDWAALRAQATKLGISLSQLQQQQLEKKMRLARKSQYK